MVEAAKMSCRSPFARQNFPTKGRCYLLLNMTEMVVDEKDKALRSEDLVGLNATLTFELMNGRQYRTFEQVDQVSSYTSQWDVIEGFS